MDEIREKVKAFLARFFRRRQLSDEEDIFAQGFVNSLFAMQLVMFLEKEFKIKVDNKDLDVSNFSSINAIVNLIEKKLNSMAI